MTSRDRPQPGRPRSREADAAIVRAVLETIFADGVSGVTIEGVARRAGVAKTTIYRRWHTRDAMVADALRTTFTGLERPDTGSAREDLKQLVATRSNFFTSHPGPPGVSRLLLSVAADERHWQAMMGPRRNVIRGVLERGQDRGEIRPDIDLDLAVDLVLGALVLAVVDPAHTMDREFLIALVETVLDGIAQRP